MNVQKNRNSNSFSSGVKLALQEMSYYAVPVGRVPGIYRDWPATQQQVKRFPGAIFKKFSSQAAAEQFLHAATPETSSRSGTLAAYTDGSYAHGLCGFAVVIPEHDEDGRGYLHKTIAYGRVPLPASNNVAELYAIYVALSLLRARDVDIYTDSRYSISVLTGYIHSWKESGWAGVANKELIVKIAVLLENRNVRFVHVAAHRGDRYNEEADSFANRGRLQTRHMVRIDE